MSKKNNNNKRQYNYSIKQNNKFKKIIILWRKIFILNEKKTFYKRWCKWNFIGDKTRVKLQSPCLQQIIMRYKTVENEIINKY